ncbi:hypothetical protein POM88_051719 [Heracleum sosnowskyi]|uniref:Replication factor A C-terminal domain-containing protein n=1 Tax=Heracleum sosnowskyi TaxID=360622 RepID=A0AAD8H162_9APIA|nr:hypothetical protein POM88_051719 [Heracleum sosnowskyi]
MSMDCLYPQILNGLLKKLSVASLDRVTTVDVDGDPGLYDSPAPTLPSAFPLPQLSSAFMPPHLFVLAVIPTSSVTRIEPYPLNTPRVMEFCCLARFLANCPLSFEQPRKRGRPRIVVTDVVLQQRRLAKQRSNAKRARGTPSTMTMPGQVGGTTSSTSRTNPLPGDLGLPASTWRKASTVPLSCGDCCNYGWYKLIVRVVDISGTTTFTLFNKEVERLVVVPVENILAELTQDNPTTEMPAVLNNVIDKTCGFDVKISSYNTNLGYEEYTVVKLSEYDPAEVEAVAETSGAGAEAQNTT